MERKLNLVVKSEKQYNKAVRKLSALGVREFLLAGYDERRVGLCNYGIGCFVGSADNRFTDGTSSPDSGWENFHTVKSFIKAVAHVLGESK